eukprot:GHVP01057899.1.p2 GENE.GHVP01057899.1~~GHVP01057899.1.p2  ORF type:complete len:288 (+),score=60.20 GHVP01057899.1:2639-3502(+)
MALERIFKDQNRTEEDRMTQETYDRKIEAVDDLDSVFDKALRNRIREECLEYTKGEATEELDELIDKAIEKADKEGSQGSLYDRIIIENRLITIGSKIKEGEVKEKDMGREKILSKFQNMGIEIEELDKTKLLGFDKNRKYDRILGMGKELERIIMSGNYEDTGKEQDPINPQCFGLHNTVGLCFMNVVFYSLFNLPVFRLQIEKLRQELKQDKIIVGLNELFNNMAGKDLNESSSNIKIGLEGEEILCVMHDDEFLLAIYNEEGKFTQVKEACFKGGPILCFRMNC